MSDKNIKKLYSGRKTIKKFRGTSIEMTPFLCTSDNFKIGIGIENSKNEGLTWGLHSPITIIRWWRSLKVLEKLHAIEDNTLALCFNVTGEIIDNKSFLSLAEQMGGEEAFRIVLNTILISAPSQVDLIRMISNLRSKGIEVNHQELREEIGKDTIVSDPVVRSVITKALRYESKYEKTKKPLPKEHRLNLFFISLGIKSIRNEDEDLYYLDLRIRRHCIGNKKIQSYSLFTYKNSEAKPTYLSFTGTTYVFDSVKFCKGRFYVKTKIKIPNQEETVGEYTLAELREKIGPITLGNFPKTRKVLSTLITCLR